MNPIRTIIVDDEKISRKGLSRLLSEKNDFQEVAICADGREAIEKIRELKPELLLLDIQMPEINGFQVLDRIPPENLPVVIFITAYDEFAIKAFEVHAIDYILKPLSQDRFNQALTRAKELIRDKKIIEHSKALMAAISDYRSGSSIELANRVQSTGWMQRIMVKDNKRIVFIEVSDIDWIEGADYYVILHCGKNSHLYRESLKNLEAKLDPEQFVRIHMSAIVNLRKVKEIQSAPTGRYRVILENGKELKVSRRRKKNLLELGAAKFGLRN